jgi:hypothetical protein
LIIQRVIQRTSNRKPKRKNAKANLKYSDCISVFTLRTHKGGRMCALPPCQNGGEELRGLAKKRRVQGWELDFKNQKTMRDFDDDSGDDS